MGFAVRLTAIFLVVVLTGAACHSVLAYADCEWLWMVPDKFHFIINFAVTFPIVVVGVLIVYALFKGRN